MAPMLTTFFNKVLNFGVVPSEYKDVIITILFKSGDDRICDDYRGISLVNVVGKIFERLIQNRVVAYCEETLNILPATQFGFRAKLSTQDGIFMSRLVSSSARELQQALCKWFVDLV